MDVISVVLGLISIVISGKYFSSACRSDTHQRQFFMLSSFLLFISGFAILIGYSFVAIIFIVLSNLANSYRRKLYTDWLAADILSNERDAHN
ncbi:hypothetical protein A3715_17050 [Oleiphilus sp. HI0009]|nr:hypothetical protein A3715_17050 [Oleiphilus sp. HI0009]